MRDAGGRHASILSPRPSIENSCDGREQYIAPVEMRGAEVPFVEVRQAEQNRSEDQRREPSYAPLQQILYPGTKEKFLGDGNKNEDSHPAKRSLPDYGNIVVGMDEPQGQTEQDDGRREEE